MQHDTAEAIWSRVKTAIDANIEKSLPNQKYGDIYYGDGEKSVCRASECISVADYYKSETCKSRFLLKVTAEHLISDFKKIKGSL